MITFSPPGFLLENVNFVWGLKFLTCVDFDRNWYVPVFEAFDNESEVEFPKYLVVVMFLVKNLTYSIFKKFQEFCSKA